MPSRRLEQYNSALNLQWGAVEGDIDRICLADADDGKRPDRFCKSEADCFVGHVRAAEGSRTIFRVRSLGCTCRVPALDPFFLCQVFLPCEG